MRQAGVIAAAGIVALDEMVDRLAEDHANARRLADGIAEVPGIGIDPSAVQTDIVIFDVAQAHASAADLVAALRQRGVQVSAIAPSRIRAVTHLGVTAGDVDATIAAVREAMEAL
jgi:threonine aldolase